MKTLTHTLVATVAIALSAPAFAQAMTPDPAAPPSAATGTPATPAPSAAPITDAEVTQFAKAVVALEAIQKDTTLAVEQKQAQMAAKVQEQGLEPAKFNVIAQAAQADPELQTKVQAAIQAEAGSGTTPTQ